MKRRNFILKTVASIAVTGLSIPACTSTATMVTPPLSDSTKRRNDIDEGVKTTLSRLGTIAKGSHELLSKANGVLVFPSVIAAGLGIGGQYGEGELRLQNGTSEYYNLASISIGLQIGAQTKSIIFLFMTQEALNKFRSSKGWQVGADASVAMLKIGANGDIDSTAGGPVMAFVLTNAGLMINLTLEGTKITHLKI